MLDGETDADCDYILNLAGREVSLFRAFTTGELLSAMAASSGESTDFCHSPLPIFRLSITLSYKLPSAVQIHWVLKVRISERICLICGRARAGIIATGNESHVGIFLFGRLDDGCWMGSERGRAKYGNFAFIRSQRVARPLFPLGLCRVSAKRGQSQSVWQFIKRERDEAGKPAGNRGRTRTR